MPKFREDQAVVHALVNGVNTPASWLLEGWSSFSGGDPDANNVKVFPGNMLNQEDLGGVVTWSDITIERPYSDSVHLYVVQWANVCGRADMWASYTPKDANGNPLGGTFTYKGKLKSVKRPQYSAAATGTAAYLALVMSVTSLSPPST